jgi:cbb3-type cytochrome oxidase maturation protein
VYLPIWVILVIVSLGTSLLAFVWALQAGQFSDQGRARYLALRDEPLAPPADPAAGRFGRMRSFALAAVGAMGLMSLTAAVLLSIWRR